MTEPFAFSNAILTQPSEYYHSNECSRELLSYIMWIALWFILSVVFFFWKKKKKILRFLSPEGKG